MISSSIVDYTIGRLIETKSNKKLYLAISIIINLSMLMYFKYQGFFIDNINNIFSLNISYKSLPLPIGISFFTFQTMSYSVDVYRKNIKAQKNFFTFLTYVSMFPQLIAGPIVRYIDVEKNMQKKDISLDNFYKGFIRFLNGLFKKVLIANTLGLLFMQITINPYNEISILSAYLAIIAFTLQIYFDFSGYSCMAIGIGKMIGFNYPENFNYPFISSSIKEFWSRWHMSLSSWFKDYVYIPLGGNKKHAIRNLFIVWLLTGFWHGAQWNFILWGLYFGVLLYLEKYIFKNTLNKTPKVIKHISTLILVLFSFYIFAFDNIDNLLQFGKILFGISNNSLIDETFYYYLQNNIITIIIAIVLSTGVLKERIKYNMLTNVIYIILFIITVSNLLADTYNPFLYFRF